MSFGVQELAGLLRSQIHERTFDLLDVKIVSAEFGTKPGTLRIVAKVYDPKDPDPQSSTKMNFEVKIEQTR